MITEDWEQSSCAAKELVKEIMVLLGRGILCSYKNDQGD